jgi:hypothetical protein
VRHAAFRFGRAGKKALFNEGSIAKNLFGLAFDQISMVGKGLSWKKKNFQGR